MYRVVNIADLATETDWSFTVPGQQLWRLFTISAELLVPVGTASPLLLTATNGTDTFDLAAAVTDDFEVDQQFSWLNGGAQEFLTDPGAGATFSVPLPDVVLEPGWTIAPAHDAFTPPWQWARALAFVDDLNLGPQTAT